LEAHAFDSETTSESNAMRRDVTTATPCGKMDANI